MSNSKELVDGLIKSLDEQPLKATANIISFAKNYATESILVRKAIVLRQNFLQSNKEVLDLSTREEYKKLILQISEAPKQTIKEIPPYVYNESRAKTELKKQEKKIVFEGDNLSKKYRSFKLEKINLSLRLGEITGLVGENASGKTTLIKIVSGEINPTAGNTIYPFFQDSEIKDWFKIKRNIAYVPQFLDSWGDVELKTQLHYEAAIRNINGEQNDIAVDFIIQRLGLENYLNHSWSSLSGGYKLRFALAKALVWNPKLLILDEPLANLDIRTQKVLLDDLRVLADSAQNPIAILISSQHLREIDSISDHTLYLSKGTSHFYGNTTNIASTRAKNIYEFKCQADLDNLKTIFSATAEVEVKNNNRSFVIETSKYITANDVLKKLIENNILIESFEDITRSSKIWFYD